MIYFLSSLSVLLICALFVGLEINRGIKRGLRRTLVSLSGVFVSIFVGLFIARYLGGVVGRYALNIIKKLFFKGNYIGGSMNMEKIAVILVQALISSVLFVAAFLIIRLIFSIVVRCVLKHRSSDASVEHLKLDKTREQKRERFLSIVAGALCGVIVTATITSPVLGAFDLVHSMVDMVDRTDMNIWSSFKLNETQVRKIDDYSENLPSVLVYSMGGRTIYTASATAMLDGELISVPLEMRALSGNVDEARELIEIFGQSKKITAQDIQKLETVCELVEESAIFRYVLTEYIQKGTTSWLNNSSFMFVSTPTVPVKFDALFKEILRVCSSTTADSVGEDTKTLVHIYQDILDAQGKSEKNLIDAIANGDVMMNINNEIKQNSRMNSMAVRNELYDIVIATIAAKMALTSSTQSTEKLQNYVSFMEGMAKSTNEVLENATLTRDQMIAQLASAADTHCKEMGHSFSFSSLSLVSEALIDEFMSNDEPVSATDMASFFGSSIMDVVDQIEVG